MEKTLPLLPEQQRDPVAQSSEHDQGAVADIPATSRSPSPEFGPTNEHLLHHQPAGKDATSHQPSAVPRSSRRAHFLKNWWIEFSACLIFVFALIAIIVTLRPHQNKPLPQWPYSISINSLISIYVVILKAAILLVTAEGLGTFQLEKLSPLLLF